VLYVGELSLRLWSLYTRQVYSRWALSGKQSQFGHICEEDKNYCVFQKLKSFLRLLARHFTGLANSRNKIIQEFADLCCREVKGACCTLLGRCNTGNRLRSLETWLFTAFLPPGSSCHGLFLSPKSPASYRLSNKDRVCVLH
jgi:hypothetical protein